MTEQYYVRIRGRVQGPFDGEKIRVLARRGQLSRMHEISTDGATWNSGADYPELFASAGTTAASQQAGKSSESAMSAVQDNHLPANTSQAVWFYAVGNEERGPLDVESLRARLASRELRPDTLVWRDGMPQWARADQVPGLLPQGGTVFVANPSAASNVESAKGAASAGELSATAIRALNDSRGWVLFLASAGYVLAALSLSGGLLLIISGARDKAFLQVAEGLFSLVHAAIFAVGALMLSSIANRIAKCSAQRTEQALVSALDAMRTFWAYVGILTIVWLALLLILVIWIFSIGVTWSRFSSERDAWTMVLSAFTPV